MIKLLKKVGKPGQTVLDPFCGTGSTAVAALMCDMHFVTIDMSARYVEIARLRIEKTLVSGIQQELFTPARDDAAA